jgi:hypothetical protein
MNNAKVNYPSPSTTTCHLPPATCHHHPRTYRNEVRKPEAGTKQYDVPVIAAAKIIISAIYAT